jgi:hypothetical protein
MAAASAAPSRILSADSTTQTQGAHMPNLPGPLSLLPWFEELRSRAERSRMEALRLLSELRATLSEIHHTRNRAPTLKDSERAGAYEELDYFARQLRGAHADPEGATPGKP